MSRVQVHLPSLLTAIIALVCASYTIVVVRGAQKREAHAQRVRLRDLAVMAEWVDSTCGTADYPAPGSVTFYTLHPLAQWPKDYFPPNTRMDGRCPLPQHDLRVVVPHSTGRPVWAATCQRCAAHWTARDAPPPVEVARMVHDKLTEMSIVTR